MSYIEQKCDDTKEDNFDGNVEGFSVRTYDYEILGLLYSTMLGVADYYKVLEEFFFKKVNQLVYLSELLKASFKVP